MTIKECIINGYLEENVDAVRKTGDLERADKEWEKELTCSRLPNMGDRDDIDSAAYLLAGRYQVAGLNAGFDIACRMFAEILTAAFKGGDAA